MYEYDYRILKASWGISININGDYSAMDSYEEKEKCKEICTGLWATAKKEVPVVLQSYIWDGLSKVDKLILDNTPHKLNTLIIINSLHFGFCDFQEEGLTAAIVEWAAKVFDFEPPKIDVTFNKLLNRYEFKYF